MKADVCSAEKSERFRGELDLEFSKKANGTTGLRRRMRSGLFHLSKEYLDGEQLVVQVLNPTAGIFEGDVLESRVEVGDGANVCLLSPSSNQVYTMPDGGEGVSRQHFEIEGEGALVVLPKWTVMHRGARFRQETEIRLGKASRLFFVEMLSAGRKHHGEFLDYESYDSKLAIYREGSLTFKEIIRSGKARNRWIWSGSGGDFGYIVTLYISIPMLGEGMSGRFSALGKESLGEIEVGITEIEKDFVIIRMMAQSTVDVGRVIATVVEMIADLYWISPIYKRIT